MITKSARKSCRYVCNGYRTLRDLKLRAHRSTRRAIRQTVHEVLRGEDPEVLPTIDIPVVTDWEVW